MKTYKIYTVSQAITVSNCRDENHAIEKAGISKAVVFKVEELTPKPPK